MTQSLLIYDGRNVLFRAVVEAATSQSDDIVPVRWDAEPVQAFLDSQFDARPFAFILVEGDAAAGDLDRDLVEALAAGAPAALRLTVEPSE